ncbi:MdFT1 like protein [Pyrus ussuriensis x Pyrus communis]|uniref:MdFT1 like protein n=1 Tax=Pyrus ussuriensis x Pyrus communis TaxID=2448454 RepID=A0A5N5I6Z2_9ROSA|nr:MdFT1 like protein [Pyrus ussuriensis x Pyrus communis]
MTRGATTPTCISVACHSMRSVCAAAAKNKISFPARGGAGTRFWASFPARGVAATTPRPHVASPLPKTRESVVLFTYLLLSLTHPCQIMELQTYYTKSGVVQ